VHLAVHFLDNVVEVNRHPIARTEEWSRMNRKIGVGVMGFADMLILLGVPYQSSQALVLAEQIMSHIQQYAESASAELAARRGNFPAFHQSVFPRKRCQAPPQRHPDHDRTDRHHQYSGRGEQQRVEPVFAYEVQRRIVDQVFTDVHPIYDRYRREGRPSTQSIFQTAWDVSPHWHLKIQAAFQKYTDNAVSKTVNLPETITVDQIRDLFLAATDMNLKGITVYRDQSHPDQILSACSLKNEECVFAN
jgi:ribonucleoside-diphosphate reductase alpha chain